MRIAALCLIACSALSAQFRSTVPLVVAPTTITDAKGRYVDGLDAPDLLLYDNNVPQTVHLDWMTFPISLVVAVQTSENARPVLDKLGGSGILFANLLAGEGGETAVVTFGPGITVRQNFTTSSDELTTSLKHLRAEGGVARSLDAIHRALEMLAQQPAGRRHIILMIAEKRDRGSESDMQAIMEEVQRQNAAVYWLTFSPFMQPFTAKQKLRLEPGSERWQNPDKKKEPSYADKVEEKRRLEKEGKLDPPDIGPGGYLYALMELFHMSKPDIAEIFTRASGGTTDGFLKQNALENAIQSIGKEVHRQYILSFQPSQPEPGKFHEIRVTVKGYPDLHVKTRAGYWAVQ